MVSLYSCDSVRRRGNSVHKQHAHVCERPDHTVLVIRGSCDAVVAIGAFASGAAMFEKVTVNVGADICSPYLVLLFDLGGDEAGAPVESRLNGAGGKVAGRDGGYERSGRFAIMRSEAF